MMDFTEQLKAMNRLSEGKRRFKDGLIDKWQYIDEMWEIHSCLFDYSEFLADTNISEISISDNRVVMRFRDSEVKFLLAKNDKRLAPLEALNFGSYEQAELEMQLKLIEPEFTVLDIGANFGWYAMHVGKYKPFAQILSFEPIPSTFKWLNENIELNDFKNIKTFNFGFSDEKGTFDFYFEPSLSVNASLANVSGNKEIQGIKCSVRKLDDFTEPGITRVDFIKCDVEGAELLVFKGGVELIKRDCPVIFTEMLRKWTSKFNYHPNDIISFFKELGYSCFVQNNGKLRRFDQVDENTPETNYFFLHGIKHSRQISDFLEH